MGTGEARQAQGKRACHALSKGFCCLLLGNKMSSKDFLHVPDRYTIATELGSLLDIFKQRLPDLFDLLPARMSTWKFDIADAFMSEGNVLNFMFNSKCHDVIQVSHVIRWHGGNRVGSELLPRVTIVQGGKTVDILECVKSKVTEKYGRYEDMHSLILYRIRTDLINFLQEVDVVEEETSAPDKFRYPVAPLPGISVEDCVVEPDKDQIIAELRAYLGKLQPLVRQTLWLAYNYNDHNHPNSPREYAKEACSSAHIEGYRESVDFLKKLDSEIYKDTK